MMKNRLTLIISILLVFNGSYAQTNLNVEAWTGSGPTIECDDWGSLNFIASFFGGPQSTFQDTINPGEGLSSALIETVYFIGGKSIGLPSDTMGGMLTLGGGVFNPMGVPYTQKPGNVSFMYKANVQSGDTAMVFIQLSHYNGTTTVVDALGELLITGTSGWQNVSLPFTYMTGGTPDTLQINCYSSRATFFGGGLPIIGTQLYVDNFVLGVCVTPTALFTAVTSGLTAIFSNGSIATGTPSYSWDFGDGSGTSNAQNPVYSYAIPGTYNVCLTVFDSCGSNSFCQIVTVGGGGCAPTASFTSFPAGMTVIFNDASTTTGVTTYIWDFGDSLGSSSQANPFYTYSVPGIYNVCLTVTDSCGTNTFCQWVTASGGGCPTPAASFNWSSSGLTAVFSDFSATTGTVSYFWNFGDGSGSSIQQNPIYTYQVGGTYNVCLTVTDSCGSDQTCLNITVVGGGCPTPTATFNFTIGGLSVIFADASTTTGAVTYFWNFGDGSGTSAQQNPSYTYAVGGTYNVCLTVVDSCDSNQSCQNITVVGTGCPIPIGNFASSATGLSVVFTDVSTTSGNATYIWDFGDGTGTSILQNPQYTYGADGTYSVCMMVTDSCGSNTVCKSVTVLGAGCTLSLTVTSTDESVGGMNDGTGTALASGGSMPYLYLWDDPSNQTTSIASGLAPGFYMVLVTDADSCTESATIFIQAGVNNCLIQINITATNETSIGGNDGTATAVVTLGTPSYTYLWSTGATTSAISGLAPGVYTCSVVDADGCQKGSSGVVQAFQCTLTGTVTSSDETIQGASDGTASVSATGGSPPYSFQWDNFATTANITGLAAGFYGVTVTDAEGCTYSASAAVNPGGIVCSLSATAAGTNESQAGANDGTATLNVTNGTALIIQWLPGGQSTTMITGLAPGDYTVNVTDSLGCIATATYTVQPGLIIGVLEKPAPEVSVHVYPNPASDLINFEVIGEGHGILYILDFAGRNVKEVVINQTVTEISTSGLRDGMYFYQLIGKGSDKLRSGKFVIHK